MTKELFRSARRAQRVAAKISGITRIDWCREDVVRQFGPYIAAAAKTFSPACVVTHKAPRIPDSFFAVVKEFLAHGA